MPDNAHQSKAELAEALYKEHEKLYSKGRKSEALRKLREAASLGAPYAISALAYEYYNEHTGRMPEALALYRRAAAKGDFLSAWNLARHYELKRNVRAYLFWLRKASQMGMAEADQELLAPFPYLLEASLKLSDKGRSREASSLLRLAARHGNRAAQTLLERSPSLKGRP